MKLLGETVARGKPATSNPATFRQAKRVVDQTRQALAEMRSEEESLLAERLQASRASFRKARLTLLVATGLAMAVIALAYALFARDTAARERLAADNRLLLDSTGEGIYGIDLQGNCTFLNRAGALLLGLNSAEVLGKNMHALVHHRRADGSPYPADECPISRVLQTGQGGPGGRGGLLAGG